MDLVVTVAGGTGLALVVGAVRSSRRPRPVVVLLAGLTLLACACSGGGDDATTTSSQPPVSSGSGGDRFSFRYDDRMPPQLAPFAAWVQPALAAHKRAFRIIDANKVDTQTQTNQEIRRRLRKNGDAWLTLARQLEALPAPPEVDADINGYIDAVRAAGAAALDLAGCDASSCGQQIAAYNRTQARLGQAHTDLVAALGQAAALKRGSPSTTSVTAADAGADPPTRPATAPSMGEAA
jgi:hypothetical protein